ncbi:hypothetical protein ACQUJT_16050 [Ralstonia pseudosolanacearum]
MPDTLRFTPNYVALLIDIGEQISEGWTSVRNLESLSINLTGADNYTDEEYEMEELAFESKLKRIHISLCLLLESLGYVELLAEFRTGYSKFAGNLTSTSVLPYVGEWHSSVLGYFWQFHRTLSSLLGVDVQETEQRKHLALLESILQNTPKIVYDRDIEPSSEADVRKCVYDILIHVFHDTVREIPITQVTKTYKPDLGVRSLKTAVEYKYAVDEGEAKKFIGGFYEDMRGYAGSEDWQHFYAVLYMTKPFFTVQQIQAEFKIIGADKNWTPILVHGDGRRKRARA